MLYIILEKRDEVRLQLDDVEGKIHSIEKEYHRLESAVGNARRIFIKQLF